MEPLQPPEAIHAVAFVADHVSVADAPLATCAALVVSVREGAGDVPEPPVLVAVLSLPPPQAESTAEAAVATAIAATKRKVTTGGSLPWPGLPTVRQTQAATRPAP